MRTPLIESQIRQNRQVFGGLQLSVILHRMWVDGTEFNWSAKEVAAQSA